MSKLGGGTQRLAAVNAFIDELGEGGVQANSLAWQQVPVHRLGQQRVAERVALALLGDQHLVGDRLTLSRLQLGAVQFAGAGEQFVPDPAASDRGHPNHLLGRRRQLLEAGQQDVGKRGRKRRIVI